MKGKKSPFITVELAHVQEKRYIVVVLFGMCNYSVVTTYLYDFHLNFKRVKAELGDLSLSYNSQVDVDVEGKKDLARQTKGSAKWQ